MTEEMYCLQCESWKHVANGGHTLYLPAIGDLPADIDWCSGPFTYSEPPETNDTEWGWDLFISEPDAEELAQMNEEVEYIYN